jgi:hypothetical protein
MEKDRAENPLHPWFVFFFIHTKIGTVKATEQEEKSRGEIDCAMTRKDRALHTSQNEERTGAIQVQKQRWREQEHEVKKEKKNRGVGGRSMFLQIVPYHTTNSKKQSIIQKESNRSKALRILHYGKH